jgi:Uma2 family endonuclease
MATATSPPIPVALKEHVVNDTPVTVEEYLERERSDPKERHEFIDGWLIPVTGASYSHNVIVSNINGVLRSELRDTNCRATTNDLRVALPSAGTYTYPDVVVVCGEPELDEEHLDMLYNPRLLVETLSLTTEDYDRGEKFARYRQLDSLQEYLLVAQNEPHVEHYVRQDETSWRFTETDGLDAEIDLPSLDASLPLSEIYLDVSFESDENE